MRVLFVATLSAALLCSAAATATENKNSSIKLWSDQKCLSLLKEVAGGYETNQKFLLMGIDPKETRTQRQEYLKIGISALERAWKNGIIYNAVCKP